MKFIAGYEYSRFRQEIYGLLGKKKPVREVRCIF